MPTKPLLKAGYAGWPSMAGWLAAEQENSVGVTIALRAFCDMLICEEPPSSNRGTRIDEYNRRAGAPPGSYWCASAAACWWEDAGAESPGYGLAPSCDEWVRYAKREGLWVPKPAVPRVGWAVLYGTAADAHHIGVVVRTTPIVRTIEGNTSISGFNRNGEGVEGKTVDLTKVVGYVRPRKRAA